VTSLELRRLRLCTRAIFSSINNAYAPTLRRRAVGMHRGERGREVSIDSLASRIRVITRIGTQIRAR